MRQCSVCPAGTGRSPWGHLSQSGASRCLILLHLHSTCESVVQTHLPLKNSGLGGPASASPPTLRLAGNHRATVVGAGHHLGSGLPWIQRRSCRDTGTLPFFPLTFLFQDRRVCLSSSPAIYHSSSKTCRSTLHILGIHSHTSLSPWQPLSLFLSLSQPAAPSAGIYSSLLIGLLAALLPSVYSQAAAEGSLKKNHIQNGPSALSVHCQRETQGLSSSPGPSRSQANP